MSFKNKQVLVTGADGFIGSHLVEMLIANDAKVRALSLYNSLNNWGWLEEIDGRDKLEVVTGDIRDQNICRRITKDVDIVFHLAALIAIPYSYQTPQSYVETNVNGTMNMCMAALENKCERILHTSTSEVYGTAKYVPIDEKHPLQAQSPYSASKIAADAIAMSFYYSFELPLTVVRPFNTYGPRQSARAIIPTIIAQLASDVKRLKLGDVTPTRDFNYVRDTCQGFLSLADCDKAIGETVNIGSNSETSVRKIVEHLKEIMRKDVDISFDEQRVRPEGSEVKRLWCDNSKMKSLTGYEPQYSLEKGLKLTVDWFQNPGNLKKYKPEIYNV